MKKNTYLLADFSLAELGVTPPPLTENHPAQEPLSEMRGTLPPLAEKNPVSSFWQVP